jgi:ABC-type dipeptide/oligopeptide/nickel transport system permease component
MQGYVVRRVFQALLVLIGVSLATFMVSHLTGDPVDLLVPESTPREEREQLRQHLGLDRPILEQYATFVWKAAHGDLGYSYVQRTRVSELVLERLPATLELAFFAFALAIAIAVPLGVTIALKRNSWTDFICTGLAMIGQAAPNFWIGLMLIVIFAVQLQILPVSGYGGFAYMILPAVTLALQSASRLTRLVRASVLEVLGADHVRTAYAKGLRRPVVLWGHILRNALIPVVTMAGLELAELLSGAFITETIFAWPGIGRLGVEAITQRDFPVIQGVVLVGAVVFVAINLLVDLLYAAIDPRVKLA